MECDDGCSIEVLSLFHKFDKVLLDPILSACLRPVLFSDVFPVLLGGDFGSFFGLVDSLCAAEDIWRVVESFPLPSLDANGVLRRFWFASLASRAWPAWLGGTGALLAGEEAGGDSRI